MAIESIFIFLSYILFSSTVVGVGIYIEKKNDIEKPEEIELLSNHT